MAYATKEDFIKYVGKDVPEDIEQLLEQASDEVDRAVFNRITARKKDGRLTEYQDLMIKKAVCYQAGFYSKYGEYLEMPMTSFTAGSISMDFASLGAGSLNGSVLDKRALKLIQNSGLAQRRFI